LLFSVFFFQGNYWVYFFITDWQHWVVGVLPHASVERRWCKETV